MLRLAGITFVIEAICYWNGKRAAILHIWAWIISPNPTSLFMAWGCVSVSSVLFARNVLSESWHPCVFYINSLLLSRGRKIFSRVAGILKANLYFSRVETAFLLSQSLRNTASKHARLFDIHIHPYPRGRTPGPGNSTEKSWSRPAPWSCTVTLANEEDWSDGSRNAVEALSWEHRVLFVPGRGRRTVRTWETKKNMVTLPRAHCDGCQSHLRVLSEINELTL